MRSSPSNCGVRLVCFPIFCERLLRPSGARAVAMAHNKDHYVAFGEDVPAVRFRRTVTRAKVLHTNALPRLSIRWIAPKTAFLYSTRSRAVELRNTFFTDCSPDRGAGFSRVLRRDDSSSVGIEFRFSSSTGLPKAVLTNSGLQPWGNRMVASAEHRAIPLDSSTKVRSRARHIASWQMRVASWVSPSKSAISAGTSAW